MYRLIAEIDPDIVWYPALWPETYSFTLSIALHCGLPVVVPDIGAFPERVAQRALSAVMPWGSSTEEWLVFWRRVVASGNLQSAEGNIPTPQTKPGAGSPDMNFYSQRYLAAVPAKSGLIPTATLDALANNYHLLRSGLSRSERLLRGIWRISRSPLVARCVALVPFRLKQSFKRRLSSRPMHDIVYKE